jgi:hypothetical protein
MHSTTVFGTRKRQNNKKNHSGNVRNEPCKQTLRQVHQETMDASLIVGSNADPSHVDLIGWSKAKQLLVQEHQVTMDASVSDRPQWLLEQV